MDSLIGPTLVYHLWNCKKSFNYNSQIIQGKNACNDDFDLIRYKIEYSFLVHLHY